MCVAPMIAALAVVGIFASGPALSAQTQPLSEQNFQVKTGHDLLELCDPPAGDPYARDAIHIAMASYLAPMACTKPWRSVSAGWCARPQTSPGPTGSASLCHGHRLIQQTWTNQRSMRCSARGQRVIRAGEFGRHLSTWIILESIE